MIDVVITNGRRSDEMKKAKDNAKKDGRENIKTGAQLLGSFN